MLERLRAFGDLWVWADLITGMASVGAVWVIHGIAVRRGGQSKRFNSAWSGALPLSKVSRFYRSRIRWRVVARVSAFMHSRRTGPGLKMPRVLGVLMAGLLAAAIVCAVIFYLGDSRSVKDIARHLLFGERPSAGTWSLFYVFAVSPVALVLWIFRDANQVQQIENQRKDINLKDFQKLCEWASGSALVEDEVTSGHDGIQSIKSSKLPEQSSPHSATRRQGSEALQIASIQQLGGFLLGENGQQFQRPALEMLIALWQSQMQANRAEAFIIEREEAEGIGDNNFDALIAWRKKLGEIQRSVLAKALANALLSKENRALLVLSPFLPKQMLAGLNTDLPGLLPLKLWHRNLDAIQLQGAKLKKAELQGTSLIGANLHSADLTLGQLQGAKLNGASLSHARLIFANLEGADLRHLHAKHSRFKHAQLQDADLALAVLDSTDFSSSKLEGAHLIQTSIRDASFVDANLRSTVIINPSANQKTLFDRATCDEYTIIGVVRDYREMPKKRDWLPVLTHALRLKLRDTNHLELCDSAYLEYARLWTRVDRDRQNLILAEIYEYARNPNEFLKNYPDLDITKP